MNMVILSGRLGADVEIVNVSEKASVAKFSIAETLTKTNSKGEKSEKTLWHRIEAWNNVAKVCHEHLKKGKKVTIVGTMDYSEYVSKNNEHRKEPIITVQKVEFENSKTKDGISSFSTEDIPF